MDFNKFKNKIKRGKENLKYLFKETINLFYGNKTHASFFWLSIIGIFLVHYFVSESAASLLKIFALAFFAFNTTRIARGLEDMLENITPKDVEIFSFVVIITEISLGFLMSAKYFNGFIADFFSVVILALIFSQYLRYLNNKEYKEYEKELKIDAINNPKPPIMEPIIQTFKEKRTKSMETILEASSPLKVEENNLIVDEKSVDEKKSDFETFDTQAYNQPKPSMDLEEVSKIIKEEDNSLDLERARAEKLALAASEIVTMDIEFEKIYPEMIDFEDTAKLDEIEVNIKEEDLEMEESVSEDDFDDIFEDFSEAEEDVETEFEQEDLEEEQLEVEIEEESKEDEEIIEETKENEESEEVLEEVVEEIEVEEAPQKENKFEITFDDDDFSLISKSDPIDDIQEEAEEYFEIDLELDLTSVVDDEEINIKESLKEKLDDTSEELEKTKEETIEEEYDDLEFELTQEDEPRELESDNNEDVDLSFEKDEDIELELENENPMDLDIDNNEDIDLSFEKDDDLELELENENPMGSDNDEIEFDLDDMGLEFDLTSDEEDEDDEIDERFNILDSDIDLSFETDEK